MAEKAQKNRQQRKAANSSKPTSGFSKGEKTRKQDYFK
jgi:hypothetical protein